MRSWVILYTVIIAAGSSFQHHRAMKQAVAQATATATAERGGTAIVRADAGEGP